MERQGDGNVTAGRRECGVKVSQPPREWME